MRSFAMPCCVMPMLPYYTPIMQILLPTDNFPPGKVGGAARSAHTLARALIAAGHHVTALVPALNTDGVQQQVVDAIPTLRLGYRAPGLPFVQNYFRHERLWPRFADLIIEQARQTKADLIHAQHAQSTAAAVLAGQKLGLPVVATVRDHWPWDYFTIGLHGDQLPYPNLRWPALLTDLPARLGPLKGAVAMFAAPYILSHLQRRATALARADAIIAVSSYIARRLQGVVPSEKIHVIHNIVDVEQIARIAATPSTQAPHEPFILYAGKLEPNKGAGVIPAIFRAMAPEQRKSLPPLVLAGNGILHQQIEDELRELGVNALFLGWVDYDELLRLMARCELLLFPSLWGEPLSRVPLEAGALGTAVLAMPTGGTPEIVRHGETGMLAATPERFAQLLLQLCANQPLRKQLGEAAGRHIRQHFTAGVIIPLLETLYTSVVDKY
jgi:glycogen synthase